MTMQSSPTPRIIIKDDDSCKPQGVPRKRVKLTGATSKLGNGKFFLVESSEDPSDCWECDKCQRVNQPEEQVCSCSKT